MDTTRRPLGHRRTGGERFTATVLLVDENALLTRSLARCWAKLGWITTAARSHAEARGCAGPYDCGVFDVTLGPCDGVALAEQLLSDGVVRAAVFFTGTTDGLVLQRASRVAPTVLKDESIGALERASRERLGHVRRFWGGNHPVGRSS